MGLRSGEYLVHHEVLYLTVNIIDRSLSSEATLAKLRECVGGVPVTYAYDAVSEKDTQPMAYDALAEGGALVVAVSRFTFWKERVKCQRQTKTGVWIRYS